MTRSPYEEEVETRVLAPAAPAVVWGALMAVALIGAGATVLRSHAGAGERLVTASDDRALQRDVDRLAAERNELAGRLASLERSFGEFKLAARSGGGPETTGSISRPPSGPAAQASNGQTTAATTWTTVEPGSIGVSIGREGTMDEIRRRWTAVSARYPQQLGKLTPRIQRGNAATGLVALVAGPFANLSEAERACAALAEQGLACDTTSYAGALIGRP